MSRGGFLSRRSLSGRFSIKGISVQGRGSLSWGEGGVSVREITPLCNYVWAVRILLECILVLFVVFFMFVLCFKYSLGGGPICFACFFLIILVFVLFCSKHI